jgi:signal transduction histidine kinase
VAVSALSAAWMGKEPAAIAVGLADALVDLLHLDFLFVRLNNRGGAEPVDVTRGDEPPHFAEWLANQGIPNGPLRLGKLPLIGRNPDRCRSLIVPVGFDRQGGMVAALCERGDFPTAIDELLVSLTANQAAVAFQGAQLIEERRRAEGGLRHARDELELKVEERTTQLAQLAAEQAALRRVAVLVAQQPSPEEVFTAVTEAVGPLLGADLSAMHVFPGDGTATVIAGWSTAGPMLPIGTRLPLDGDSVAARIFRTSAPARLDSYVGIDGVTADVARDLRVRTAVGAPILVEGQLWGALMAATRGDSPLPEDAETRIAAFTELVATAVSNAQAREDLQQLADEQAALRRLATLVAEGVSPAQVFSTVSEEVGRQFGSDIAGVVRFDHSGQALVFVGVSKSVEPVIPVGTRWRLEDALASREVYRTGRPARADNVDWSTTEGPVASAGRRLVVSSTVASPIIVEGRLWGAATISAAELLPADAERRLEKFAEIIATAIANADSREARDGLTAQAEALRRIATLVAAGVQPANLYAVMAEKIGLVCEIPATSVVRFEPDGTATELANWHHGRKRGLFPVGVRMNIEGVNILRLVRDSGNAERIDDYSKTYGEMADIVRASGIRSTVAVPVIAAGRLWGTMVGSTTAPEPLPADTATRLAAFTELLATAIENAESREALEQLAGEQAALRRVATLVAQGVQPAEIFVAVSDEVASLFGTNLAAVGKFDRDGHAIELVGPRIAAGGQRYERWDLDDFLASAEVLRSGDSARADRRSWATAGGATAERLRSLGVVSTVACPIVVEGDLWGTISVASVDEPLPSDTETRLEKFTELVATAIANAESKSALAASRRRIVAASDEARRRIERDLHDGAQQRLVSIALGLRDAALDVPAGLQPMQRRLDEAADEVDAVIDDLRELARGIHPAILLERGLAPALRTLALRSRLPVELELGPDVRLSQTIEVGAYYIVSEALTNVAKHANATRVRVVLEGTSGWVRLVIDDDGVGGADASRGSGLIGLRDRVEALGGSLRVESAPGGGTMLDVMLPLDASTDRVDRPA